MRALPSGIEVTGPLGMPTSQRAYVIAMCALIGAAFAYTASDWGRWTHLAYLPVRGTWAFASGGFGGIAMHFVGLVLWGLGGLAVGALVGAGLCRVMPRAWPERRLQLFGAWALAAFGLAGGYFTWGLWPW